MSMFICSGLLLLWCTDVALQQSVPKLDVQCDRFVISCTPVCVCVAKDGDAVEQCEYTHLQRHLSSSAGTLDQFRSILSRYIDSSSVSEQEIAHLALGWSFHENYFMDAPTESVIDHFKCYADLGGDDAMTMKILIKYYVDHGEIDKALHYALKNDVSQLQKMRQSLTYVRVLFFKDKMKDQPSQSVKYLENSPQNWLLAIFSYKYLRTILGLSAEQIVQNDVNMWQCVKHHDMSSVQELPQEQALIFYWRACCLTKGERNTYNQAVERKFGVLSAVNTAGCNTTASGTSERVKRVGFVETVAC